MMHQRLTKALEYVEVATAARVYARSLRRVAKLAGLIKE